MTITVYGHSDDLIEVDGDLREEFTYDGHDGAGDLLGFSDGTLLRILFDRDGVWRITTIKRGASDLDVVQCEADSGDGYSDRATLSSHSQVRWVVHGSSFIGARG